MKIKLLIALSPLLAWLSGLTHAAPLGTAFTYQGRLTDGTNPVNGSYTFQFELYNAPTNGTQIGGTIDVDPLQVVNGLFTVQLDFGANAFSGEARWLQITVNSALLSPRQPILPAPHALFVPLADGVTAGAITSNMLANGAVTAAKLATGAVTSVTLADTIALGATNVDGRLDVYRTGVGTPAIQLLGNGNLLRIFSEDGVEKTRLDAGLGWGQLQLNNNSAAGQRAAILTANATGGGSLTLYNSNGNQRAFLFGANGGGELELDGSDGLEKVQLSASTVGALTLNNNFGFQGVACAANFINGGGYFVLNNTNGQTRAVLDGGSAGGKINLYNGSGGLSVDLRSQFSAGNTAAWVGLNDNGAPRITFAARNGSTGVGGLIGALNGSGVATVLIAGDDGAGKGRVTTSVLQITGGSDLSEQFDVGTKEDAVKPGMVVCIDPRNPGKLVMSTKAYDRTVAGIVSGAGGVSPGMLMGQQGTVADGKHPVALTGRVYCLVDAGEGAIQPGDLLTSSEADGHAMKAGDRARSQGAIIGKAMTPLPSGQGLVLVLISLQ